MNEIENNIINSNLDKNKNIYKSDFEVPDEYFDQLTSNIQNKVSSENHNSFPRVLKQYKYALSFVVLMIIGITVIYNGGSDVVYVELTNDDIVEFVIEDIEDGYLSDDLLIGSIELSENNEDEIQEEYIENIDLSEDDLMDFLLEDDENLEFYL